MLARTLGSKGVDTRQCASKDAGPRRGVDLVRVPHRIEKGTSASEDAGSPKGVDTKQCASKDAGP